MDFITGLPPCHHKGAIYDACMVVVDRYTKMAKYIPTTKTINSMELANELEGNIIQNFSMLEGIVSDRGSVFTSRVWTDFCFYSKVKRRLSTAFHL